MILSGYQLMVKIFASQRPSLRNVWSDVFPFNGPIPKSLIEIAGAPGTGKSIMLQELMARALLNDLYGGKNCQVIFLDLSHKFHLNTFIELLQNLMKKVGSHQSLESTLTDRCESLICVECCSADQLEFAFEEFEDLLWDYKRTSIIAIDGLDTFYWDECNNRLQRMTTHYKKFVRRLKSLCQEYNISCAYTVENNYLAQSYKPSAFFPHYLIDYKFKLKVKDGKNYLNDSLVKLSYDGIEFLRSK